MTINYDKRLADLRLRRSMPAEIRSIAKAANFASDLGFPSVIIEKYETRGKSAPVKYALGCMQELDPDATRISIEEGQRVINQLESGLATAAIPVTFEHQGSVPLNVHIRYSSDIDVLVLRSDILTVDWTGPLGATYHRVFSSVPEAILTLRNTCERILQTRFPAAEIDVSGAKSLAIQGGSLSRKVDVVPSVWHDSATYQATRQKHDRVVQVLDKSKMELLANYPFLHMKKINEKDFRCFGGAKRVIRLLKSLKRDSNPSLDLNSYEIAGLVWHFDDIELIRPANGELGLVASAQKQLQRLTVNPQWACSLVTPDGSRKILDATSKLQAVSHLKNEVDELALSIAQSLKPSWLYNFDSIQQTLSAATI